jgi:Second Messenger Oligonucleotide or Dinucleotide Synthetase domain
MTLNNRCVSVEYSGDFDIDVVPCVVDRIGSSSRYEVCNRVDDVFETTDSEAYTAWLDRRNEWVGTDKLREVSLLLKYLRDIKQTFSCKSILLTTLVGERIEFVDTFRRKTHFPDLPSALMTLVGRLDDYLQDHIELHDVSNPVVPNESFIRHWDEDKYKNFRDMIHRYREWIDDAYAESDETKSRSKWQRVFGDEFGKAPKKVLAKIEEAILLPVHAGIRDAVQAVQVCGTQVLSLVPQTVPWMKPIPWSVISNNYVGIRATAHIDRTGNRLISTIQSGQLLEKTLELRFEAVMATGLLYAAKDQEVQWQVVNSDRDAWNDDSQLVASVGSTRDITVSTGFKLLSFENVIARV